MLEKISSLFSSLVIIFYSYVFQLFPNLQKPKQTYIPPTLVASGSAQIVSSTMTSSNEENVHLNQEISTTATDKIQEKPAAIPEQSEQYKLEPHPDGQEGFYVLKNAPSEPMSTVDELNTAMNDYRVTHGLQRLEIKSDLCEIAKQRAEEADEVFSHDKFGEHLENGDYNHIRFSQIGENLFKGSFSGVHIVEYAWDQSPSHRPNMHYPWTKGCGGVHNTAVAFVFAK